MIQQLRVKLGLTILRALSDLLHHERLVSRTAHDTQTTTAIKGMTYRDEHFQGTRACKKKIFATSFRLKMHGRHWQICVLPFTAES